MKGRNRTWNSSLALGLFFLNAALNASLFRAGELPYRESIEGGYASMSRLIAAHPNPWGWNPFQYCGLPTQFTYLPGLPYLTAAFAWALPNLAPEHLYRIVTVTLVCLGPVSVFLFVLYFTKDRWWALAAALGYTFWSPLYALVWQISNDRGITQAPWRVQVLIKYGEGPHIAGLTLLPLALVAVWAAAVGGKYRQILPAAAALALVTLTNWIAALALALCCFTMMLAACGASEATGFRTRRVLASACLGYLLACFWLTPSFVRTTAFNWPTDAYRYRLGSGEAYLLLGLIAGLVVLRLVFVRWPGETYACFLTLTLFAFSLIVLVYYWYGKDTIPESRRYALEFELFLFLGLSELLRRRQRSRHAALRWGVYVVVALLFWAGRGQARLYATEFHRKVAPAPKEQTIEYRLARWLADQKPAGRVFASGGLRFRLNSWFEIPQIGGTFESGLRNRIPVHFRYQSRTSIGSPPGRDGHDATLQLKAMGVEYVVVHGPASQEYYRDFKNPRKFDGLLEAVHRDGDNVVYRLPFTSLAHLVRPEELPEEPPVGGYLEYLNPYVAAIDDPSRPKLQTRWGETSELQIEGPFPEGMRVSVQVTHDPGWVAHQDGRRLSIEPDRLGFMVLDPDPAPAGRIEMKYSGTTEQRLMGALSALAWIGGVGALWIRRRAPAASSSWQRSPLHPG